MEKLSKLVVRLLDRTERDLIDWQPSAGDFAFQFSLSDSSVIVERFDDNYWIEVLNGDGQVVDKASDRQLDVAFLLDDIAHSGALQKLFDIARRKALRADETLDEILAELGEK